LHQIWYSGKFINCNKSKHSKIVTTHNQELKPISRVETKHGPISRESQSGDSMVRDLWRKGFTAKVSFKFRVKEWRSDGWKKCRRERLVEISMETWNWLTKWSRKFVPGLMRNILKGAITDIHRREDWWTNKCDDRRGTSIMISLKRDEISQIDWLTGGENFVSEKDQWYCVPSSIFSQWRD